MIKVWLVVCSISAKLRKKNQLNHLKMFNMEIICCDPRMDQGAIWKGIKKLMINIEICLNIM